MRYLGMLLGAALAIGGSANAPAKAAEGRIVIAANNTLTPIWFNPSEHQGSQAPLLVYIALHDALLRPLYGDTYAKSLAESYSRSADGLVYEFVLRDGLKFQNDDPLTSADVKFSFDRYKGSAAALLKAKVASVETPDARRVQFRLKEPWPDFLNWYATSASGAAWVLPKKYIESVGDDEYRKKPVGAGPYRYVSSVPGREVVLEAFDGYWRKKPSIKTIVLRTVSDEVTRAAMLKSGEADISFAFKGALLEELSKNKDFVLKSVVIYFTQWLTFTSQWDPNSPWSKREVREAAAYAVNREALIKAEYMGAAEAAGSIVSPGVPLAKKLPPYSYDPARAKKLLAEAGYPNGFDAGDMFADVSYVATAEVVAADLATVGIRLRLRSLERAAYYALWNDKKVSGVMLSMLSGYENAGAWLEQFAARNGRGSFGTYDDVNALLVKQAATIDESERAKLLDQAQDLVRERAMFAPIVYSTAFHAAGPRVGEPGIGLIAGYGYVGPYEDITLK